MVVQYDLNMSQEVEAVSGAAMVSRRAALERVGGFDASFPYTSEDVDLCLRLRQHGSRIFYLPEATVTHIGEQSAHRHGPDRNDVDPEHRDVPDPGSRTIPRSRLSDAR